MADTDVYKSEEHDRPVERSPRGRYIRFDIRLGSGAYKTVYKAYDTDQGIDVAWNAIDIGLLPSMEKTRIIQEVQLLQKLEHKNIINFYGSWFSKEKNQVVFITEIMTSGTLKSYIKRVHFVKWKIIRRWCIQILEGLHYLHSQSPPVIHRDLKCDNIFINGNTGDLRIGDLGLSTQLAVHKRMRAQSVLGTPEFMAPELYDESYDEKVDIYAFGMCVLEMVTKEVPYSECINPAQIYKKVTAGIRPKGLQRIVSQAAKDFIELCLSRGNGEIDVSAEYLLDHPFLKPQEDDGEMIQVIDEDELERESSLAPVPETKEVSLGDELNMESCAKGSAAASKAEVEQPSPPPRDDARRPSTAPSGTRKSGRRHDIRASTDPDNEHSILLNLRIMLDGKSKEIKFPFSLFTDNTHEVACELALDVGILEPDLEDIADSISFLVTEGKINNLPNVDEDVWDEAPEPHSFSTKPLPHVSKMSFLDVEDAPLGAGPANLERAASTTKLSTSDGHHSALAHKSMSTQGLLGSSPMPMISKDLPPTIAHDPSGVRSEAALMMSDVAAANNSAVYAHELSRSPLRRTQLSHTSSDSTLPGDEWVAMADTRERGISMGSSSDPQYIRKVRQFEDRLKIARSPYDERESSLEAAIRNEEEKHQREIERFRKKMLEFQEKKQRAAIARHERMKQVAEEFKAEADASGYLGNH
ncbi:TPA: hypothetical protein N0F65_006014 [Lagenidium giganteum]|uniref:Protein kinase domain-containing protein n=1 Tax=Lagenidium giganteum TaxID=4803 RepID=A0AAV2Z6A9_9STRA|nr:TPA: hypothetical protein N0F65_006014 [Lagenidium giganteum]